MKTFEGNGYLVHSSEGGREWKDHKYIRKEKLPNGKVRYIYELTRGVYLTSDNLDSLRKKAIEDKLLEKYSDSDPDVPVSMFKRMVDTEARKEAGANGMPSSILSNEAKRARQKYELKSSRIKEIKRRSPGYYD